MTFCEINPRFRFLKYTSGDHFAKHTDEHYKNDKNEILFYIIQYKRDKNKTGKNYGGYTLVSGDKRIEPVLAFSENDEYNCNKYVDWKIL